MLVEISHKWYDIGLQLKVKPNVLNRIQSQYSDPVVCLRLTLSDWLIGINPYPTWEALAKALESRSVKEDRLAKKVRETFLVSGTTTHPAPAPPTAHPIQQMASTRAEVVADPAYHPSIHTYTPAEYNPAYNPIAPTPSQHSAQLHPYDLAYFTRIPTAIPSDPPQRPRVPIPSFPLDQALESRTVKEERLAKKVRETFLVSGTTTHPVPAPPTAHPYPIPQKGSSREHTSQVVADTVYRPPIQTRSGYNPAYLRLTQPTQRNHPYDIAYLPMAPTTMVSDEGTTNTARTTEALLSKSHHA